MGRLATDAISEITNRLISLGWRIHPFWPYPPVANVWYRALQSRMRSSKRWGGWWRAQPITMLAQPRTVARACWL